MIQYSNDEVSAGRLNDVLAAAAAEEPTDIQVTTRRNVILLPGQQRLYRVVVDGVSIRGVLALQAAAREPESPEHGQPDLLYPDQQP